MYCRSHKKPMLFQTLILFMYLWYQSRLKKALRLLALVSDTCRSFGVKALESLRKFLSFVAGKDLGTANSI